LLLIHRYREGHEYFTTIGGGVEDGETAVSAAHREGKEETGLDFELGELLWERPFADQYEHAFLVTTFSGTPTLGGPEMLDQSENNRYILEWHPLNHLPDTIIFQPTADHLQKIATSLSSSTL
jgi:8-oxo-dGTP pyrophosphatase MutT (NUDIX family)